MPDQQSWIFLLRGLKKIEEGDELKPGYFDDWAGEDENGKLSFGIDYIELDD